ncbi:hypothetical protein HanXRQr2_Chr14g0666811 [Helianthus annuus]|uniref:25S rRNA (uridine-N(3))-methyltransferase BMT5-like domain-containing protein n=1 Tax=Helianthus annuus TaxID=4232 RepID=A0A9K3H8K8_HELAN|nr:hypothetical protein HanXRQr2_Chr14g0666811 [Helianthus annuus]KAJ0842276.1 hypothetical protein HanPSC8_Chr14g0639821 [Helianthus annuus]
MCSTTCEFNVYGVIEYSRYERILTIGDGDLSFSCSMAKEIQNGLQITATTYDDHDTLLQKYENAKNNIKTLKDLGARVFHEVDTTCEGLRFLIHET